MKPLRVLVLMHEDCVPPPDADPAKESKIPIWKTEFDVLAALSAMGHEVAPLGVSTDMAPLRQMLGTFKPQIVFNLLEEFHGTETYVPLVVGYLELVRQPYTGCNPQGLMLSSGKELQKKILRHHRIAVPEYAVFPRGQSVRRPHRLTFPAIVKSATSHGSIGIAQASIVTDDEKLKERIRFIHEQVLTDAIAEEYIEGRELYVGVLGNHRLQTLPVWEMIFDNLPEGAPRIATQRVKWNVEYQQKFNVHTKAAEGLSKTQLDQIASLCKRAYRALGFTGYARMDARLSAEGRLYLLECNPNPNLGFGDDFADSAKAAGIEYPQLLQRIVGLGLRHGNWTES